MIFGIKESIFWPIHCIVSYCYTYTHATYDWFCAPLLRTEQSNIIVWIAGVHQVALLTHVDQVCNATRSDITKVYKSQAIQQAVCHAGLQCLHLKASLCHVLLFERHMIRSVFTDLSRWWRPESCWEWPHPTSSQWWTTAQSWIWIETQIFCSSKLLSISYNMWICTFKTTAIKAEVLNSGFPDPLERVLLRSWSNLPVGNFLVILKTLSCSGVFDHGWSSTLQEKVDLECPRLKHYNKNPHGKCRSVQNEFISVLSELVILC